MKVIIQQGQDSLGNSIPIVAVEGDPIMDSPEEVVKAYLEVQKILKEGK